MGKKPKPNPVPVASIRIPIPSMLAYLAYIALGLAVGVMTVIFVARQFGGLIAVMTGNLLLYSAAVFAHFRFAYGISSWPSLEKNSPSRTIAWGLSTIFLGYIAIAYIGGAWTQNFQGFDDSWHLRPEAHFQIASRHISGIPALVIIGIDGCIVAPLAEEIIFRSGLYRILKGRLSITGAATLSSAVFAISHRSVVASVPIFILGYICCWLYEKTADIRGPIIFHAGYNFLVFLPVLLGKT